MNRAIFYIASCEKFDIESLLVVAFGFLDLLLLLKDDLIDADLRKGEGRGFVGPTVLRLKLLDSFDSRQDVSGTGNALLDF